MDYLRNGLAFAVYIERPFQPLHASPPPKSVRPRSVGSSSASPSVTSRRRGFSRPLLSDQPCEGRSTGGEALGAGTVIAGLFILVLGLLFSSTIIGAIIGIPLIIVGIIVMVHGARSKPEPPIYYQPPPVYPPPVYYPPPPVVVNVHQAPHPGYQGLPPPPPPQIMRRCRYCENVYPEVAGRCPRCGASF
jgi:hypothetical protein